MRRVVNANQSTKRLTRAKVVMLVDTGASYWEGVVAVAGVDFWPFIASETKIEYCVESCDRCEENPDISKKKYSSWCLE